MKYSLNHEFFNFTHQGAGTKIWINECQDGKILLYYLKL